MCVILCPMFYEYLAFYSKKFAKFTVSVTGRDGWVVWA